MTARRALPWFAGAGAVLFLILLVTGVVLIFQYEPSGKFLWSDSEPIAGAVGRVDAVRTIHRAASFLLMPLLLVAVVLATIVSRLRILTAVLAVGAAILAVTVAATGQAIAWSQLALRVVTPGAHYRGYTHIFGGQVRFVLVGDAEVEVETFRKSSSPTSASCR